MFLPPNRARAALAALALVVPLASFSTVHQPAASAARASVTRATAARMARPAAPPRVSYHPPVNAPVIDPFRPPPVPWAPGNRGLKYATVAGTPVLAVGPGVVSFAGAVAGTLWVTVRHPDGIRTSTSLATILVARDQAVTGSTVIGLAAERLHLGARRGDTYIDPASLWGQPVGPPHVILVPLDGHGPAGLPAPGPPAAAAGSGLWAPGGGVATLVRWPTTGVPSLPPSLAST
ncbi:MAG: peptidase family protein [Acidimicrobiales bacterium]|nr:peptidase family protein [Acidimicrobiales bacterium]